MPSGSRTPKLLRKRAAGFTYVSGEGRNERVTSDVALLAVSAAVEGLVGHAGALASGVGVQPRVSAPLSSGEVVGEVVLQVSALTANEWRDLLVGLTSFNGWPVAYHQAERDNADRVNGGFWVTVSFGFSADGRKWRELDRRYERYKGGWLTTYHWRHTREANQMFVELYIKGFQQLQAAFKQAQYRYGLQTFTIRLAWTPDGRKPNWR